MTSDISGCSQNFTKSTISDSYLSLIKEMHSRHKWGTDGHKHAEKIYEIMANKGLLTALDYGCGRGTLKEKMKEIAEIITVKEYDPAIEGKNTRPLPAEMVVCTDVLEHIEPDFLDNVLDDLNNLSLKAAYLVISCRYANAVLPNGKNAHLIVKSPEWWTEKILEKFNGDFTVFSTAKELTVVVIK